MSTRQSAPTAPPSSNGGGSRLHIRSISEMSPLRDRELSVIFTEMRRATGVTQEQIAGRLATSVATVEALEEGMLSDLPDWREVQRIVTTYAAQLGLDSRPILRRMASQFGFDEPADTPPPPSDAPSPAAAEKKPAAGEGAKPAAPAGPPMPPGAGASPAQARAPQPPAGGKEPPKPASAQTRARAKPQPAPEPRPEPAVRSDPALQPDSAARPQPAVQPEPAANTKAAAHAAPAEKPARGTRARAGSFVKGLLNWALLIGFVGALAGGIWYAAKNPRAVWGAFDGLPEPIPRVVRSAWELVRPLDGDGSGARSADPETRKSDKLP